MSDIDLDGDTKLQIARDINLRIGNDINDVSRTCEFQKDIIEKKNEIQISLATAQNEVPQLISTAIRKAEINSKQINSLKDRSETLKEKVEVFLKKTKPLSDGLEKRFHAINKLDQVLQYLKSYEKIDDISHQMRQSSDDEQLVLLYVELRVMCKEYQGGHRGTYCRENAHYWHNVLKDKITSNYEDTLKQLKWPLTTPPEPFPKEALVKFSNLTRYLFLVQEPDNLINTTASEAFAPDQEPSLPVKILLRPLKKRFAFHFTGSRQTARIDRPEWFLTQTLTWIKVHHEFMVNHVQSVANKLELKNIRAVDEFNAGLISLAAERLHSVLATYHTQGTKGEIVDVDAAFAHAVDETLGFNRELTAITGKEVNSVLSVLTKAETMLRWLSVEKKYALAKMDETLQSEFWNEPVAGGANAAVGALLWVPRCADWFITLLKTIEERYTMLPQPGHRLQFLDLQVEMIEEWRIRLTQLLNAATQSLSVDTFLTAGSSLAPHPLIAVVNAAHYTYTVLLQWAHSLHYLQLFYYKHKFLSYTHMQHRHEESSSSSSSSSSSESDSDLKDAPTYEIAEGLSLDEINMESKKQAIGEIARRCTSILFDISRPIANPAVAEPLDGDHEAEEAGVFFDAPGLLAHLQNTGLGALANHIVLEFKASLWDYKKQKWHAMPMLADSDLSVSPTLCAPLSALCTRLGVVTARLAPVLAARIRTFIATLIDDHVFSEVVVDNWFNLGGTMQLIHDVTRNLVPAFAPPNQVASQINQLPKLVQACKLLNLDYEDARRLRAFICKNPTTSEDKLRNIEITHITPKEALCILGHRSDLSESNPPSVLDMF